MKNESFYAETRNGKAPSESCLVHTVKCVHAEDFIDELLPTRASWIRSNPDVSWCFRGQANAAWPLQPKVFRKSHHRRGDQARPRSS